MIDINYWPADDNLGDIQVTVPAEYNKHFKELVRRALNTWPDCHPELKIFGDKLIEGKVLQDTYYSQRSDRPLKT